MTVSMTASATRGRLLSDQEWEVVKAGCEAARDLKDSKEKVIQLLIFFCRAGRKRSGPKGEA